MTCVPPLIGNALSGTTSTRRDRTPIASIHPASPGPDRAPAPQPEASSAPQTAVARTTAPAARRGTRPSTAAKAAGTAAAGPCTAAAAAHTLAAGSDTSETPAHTALAAEPEATARQSALCRPGSRPNLLLQDAGPDTPVPSSWAGSL